MRLPTPRCTISRFAAELQDGGDDLGHRLIGYLERIEELDPHLRAMVHERDRRARVTAAAEAVVDRFPEPGDRPPLYGVPFGVKDVIHVDGLATRAGSALPPELFQGAEATCVDRLREAGGIVMGKTATAEFAGRGPPLTRNPTDLGRTPGGSSSGSAAGVAAGLFPAALGTQTFGSVIRPAAYCGIVGMKPSLGRIPRDGILERSSSVDHVGMFTQDVAGMELLAGLLCDEFSRTDVDDAPTIGVPNATFVDLASPVGASAFRSTIETLGEAGLETVEAPISTLESFDDLMDRHLDLTRAELAAVHDEWFDDYELFYRTGLADSIRKGRRVTAADLDAVRASPDDLRAEIEAVRREHGIDVWASPAATGPAPEGIQSTGDASMNIPWTHAGLPVITVPAGESADGLPLGLQLAGGFDGDEALLGAAGTVAASLDR